MRATRTATWTRCRTRSRWPCTGEGATSEGEFWEAINAACLETLPIIFLVEDNGFAISVPVSVKLPAAIFRNWWSGFPNLRTFRCDGTDFVASYAHHGGGRELLPRGSVTGVGPRHCIARIRTRFRTTSSLYKTAAERAREARHDPLIVVPGVPDRRRHPDRPALEQSTQEVDLEIQQATELALKAPPPPKGTALRYLYSETVDPTSSEFDTAANFRRSANDGGCYQPHPA